MTLEEIVQQLKEAQTVTSAQTLRHETRLKERQRWLEENELAYARHRQMMADLDEKLTQVAAAQLVNEEGFRRLKDSLQAFIDSLRRVATAINENPDRLGSVGRENVSARVPTRQPERPRHEVRVTPA
jgi:septation ring formation regulator EzrA